MPKKVKEWFSPSVIITLIGVILSSVASGAITYAKMDARLSAVEQSAAQNRNDHDLLTRLDERVGWLCSLFGKKD